jgi:hypothetical protein
MAGIFAGKKDRLCNEMLLVHQGLLDAISARRDYARSWSDLGTRVASMGISQIPQLQQQFTDLASLFGEVAEIHTTLLAAETRNADDFRDVFERFEVVYNTSNEYSDRKADFRSAAATLAATRAKIETERAKPTWSKVQSKLVHQEAKDKMSKEIALGRYKDRLRRFIDVKIKYNKFKTGRMRHGWVLYATALRTASKAEIDVFGRIRALLEEMRCDTELAPDELPQPPEPPAPDIVQSAVEAAAEALDVEITAEPQQDETALVREVPEEEPIQYGEEAPDAGNPFD